MPVLCLNEWRYRQSFCRSGTELILVIYAVIGIDVASSAVSITDVVEGLRSTSTLLVEFVSALGRQPVNGEKSTREQLKSASEVHYQR